MVPPHAIDLTLDAAAERGLEPGGFIDTGVPHYVIFVPEVVGLDVAGHGAHFRHHPAFPQGANIDFVQILDPHHLRVRTFERGVEAETLACGTGAMASSLIGHLRGRVSSPVKLDFPGGELIVEFNSDLTAVSLTGQVTPVYTGELFPEE
jgi:diaminopimelate epimerase